MEHFLIGGFAIARAIAADGIVTGEAESASAVEVGELAHAISNHIPVDGGGGEDGVVGFKGDGGAAGPVVGFGAGEGAGGDIGDGSAKAEGLGVREAVAADLDFEPEAKSVDDGETDTVQSAADGVATVRAAELATSVEGGEDSLKGGAAALEAIGGNATAVIADRDGAVGKEIEIHFGGIASESLIDAIVKELEAELMQALLPRASDVHARALPHWLQPL